jgi:putative selenate reductase FAD-binding subunit
MIIEYQRPMNIREALALLARKQPISYPMGGGTYLNRNLEEKYAVVDLQLLELGSIVKKGNHIEVGATATLQELSDFKGLPADMLTSLERETTYNLRQMATVAGTLVTANGRSPFATMLLAMDTKLDTLGLDETPKEVKLGDWFPMRGTTDSAELITKINIPINVIIAYERIARTPADQPIMCVAIAQWSSGRTRVALGGWGEIPTLAMDGPEASGVEIASKNAYSHAEDAWASAEYRQEMAGLLAARCLQRINNQ